jgi:hypothetical protein
MTRFILKWVSMWFAVCAATAGHAQTYAQTWVADEIRPEPYSPEAAVIVGRGAYPPVEMRRSGVYDDGLHPLEIIRIIRSTGYEPLGPPVRRRWVYTISAINSKGDDGRVVLDARTGQIVRFIPAEVSNDDMIGAYGPPGMPPVPEKANARTSLRPPLPVPHVTSRAPAAKSEPRTVGVAPTSQPGTAQSKPVDAKSSETKSQEAKVSDVKASEVRAPEPKPPLQLQPTQDMPAAQGLD